MKLPSRPALRGGQTFRAVKAWFLLGFGFVFGKEKPMLWPAGIYFTEKNIEQWINEHDKKND